MPTGPVLKSRSFELKKTEAANSNSLKVAQMKADILDSDVLQLYIASAVSGRELYKNEKTGELVQGDIMPIQEVNKVRKVLIDKVMPNEKVVDTTQDDNKGKWVKVIESIEEQKKTP